MIVQPLGEHRLQRLSGAFVQELTAFDEVRVVGDLLRQRVLEDVLDVPGGWLLVDELPGLQTRQPTLQFVVRLERHALHQPERKFASQHRQGLQQLLLLRRQPVYTRGEHDLHRRGDLYRVHRPGELHRPVALKHAIFEENQHYLFHEEGSALGPLNDEPLEWKQILAVAQHCREHLLGAFLAERVETKLRVIGLAIPLMRILEPIVHQQQKFRGPDRIGKQVQQLLGLLVDPVEIFEDYHQRLVERFAQQDALDRFQRPPLPDLSVHLRQRIVTLDYGEQAEQIGQRVFQTSVKREDTSGYLLATFAFIVGCRNVEIVAQQIDNRQVGAGLAMRDRECLQHDPARLAGH